MRKNLNQIVKSAEKKVETLKKRDQKSLNMKNFEPIDTKNSSKNWKSCRSVTKNENKKGLKLENFEPKSKNCRKKNRKVLQAWLKLKKG